MKYCRQGTFRSVKRDANRPDNDIIQLSEAVIRVKGNSDIFSSPTHPVKIKVGSEPSWLILTNKA